MDDKGAYVTLLLLIRHGTNDWVHGRLAGWTPGVHLNEEGRRQAMALATRLAILPIDAVYSSPLERTVETAQAQEAAAANGHRIYFAAIVVVQLLAALAVALHRAVSRSTMPSQLPLPEGEPL